MPKTLFKNRKYESEKVMQIRVIFMKINKTAFELNTSVIYVLFVVIIFLVYLITP
jgi:hypothetical protein